MSEVKTKRRLLSRRVGIILAIAVIFILAVLSFFLPSEGDSNNVTGDSAITPTLSITHPVATLTVNREVVINGIQITVKQVQEAAKFSDDRKRGGAYTVRVYVEALNPGQTPVGIDYASQTRLILPDNQYIAPKYLTIAPVALPNQKQEGYFDFPVTTRVALPALALELNTTLVAFSS